MTPSPGKRLGRFVLLGRLGDGAMGEVYRAHDPQLGRAVAVKVVRGVTEERRRRFVREQQAAARVRHPGIVAVHDAGETDGLGWLAMDLVEGESLQAVLRRGPLEAAAAVRLVAACARAVEALHAAGVLHRDLKPGNILLDRAGAPRLADFGVAALAGAEALTRTGQVIGTPHYMAPEQLTGGEVDGRADVYALGAVLYEALAGELPWGAESLVELAASKVTLPAPPSRAWSRSGSRTSASRPGRLERRADELVLRALAPTPDDRPTAAELADALERALSGEGPSRGPGLRVLLVLALVLVLAGAGVALRLRASPDEAPARRETPAALLARVEAGARGGLLALPPGLLADAAAASSTADPAAAALRAWVGLQALAAGEVERAAALATPAGGAAGLALRGGLAALRGDPAGALRDLDAAGALGPPELEAWRARALARRGVERAEAGALLARAAALRPAAPAEADLLEAACLIGQGRQADAARACSRLTAPPAELAWDLALLGAHEALAARRPLEARDALREAPPRPARPPSRREEELAGLALEAVRRRVEAGEALRSTGREEVLAALAVRARLAPAAPAPGALGLALIRLAQATVISGHSLGMLELMLLSSEVWAGDAPVQRAAADHLVALRFLDGSFLIPEEELEVEARLEAAGRRAASLARPGETAASTARLVRAAALLHLGRLDEAAAALDEQDAAARALTVPEEVRLSTGSALLLRARLAAIRGDPDRALGLLDQAAEHASHHLVTYARLLTLRDAGREDELAARALELIREEPYAGHMAIQDPLRDLVWRSLCERGAWADLARWYTRYLDGGGDLDRHLVARAAVALARSGRADEAARRVRAQQGDPFPAGWAERVARQDEPTLEALARIAWR